MLRVFDAPQSAVDTLATLAQIKTEEDNVNRPLSVRISKFSLISRPMYLRQDFLTNLFSKENLEEKNQVFFPRRSCVILIDPNQYTLVDGKITDIAGDGEMGSLYSKFDLDQMHLGHLPLFLKV